MKWIGVIKGCEKRCIAGLLIAGAAWGMADENDTVWMGGSVQWKATAHGSLKVAEQTRFKDETQYYKHTDLTAGYSFNTTWAIHATYRATEKKVGKRGNWEECDGYLLDVIHSTGKWGAVLKSRMRLAHFEPDYDADCSSDFRPRFDLLPAKGCTAWMLKPYVADEVMFRLEGGDLYRNRLSVGLKASPVSHLSVNVFVMQECTESGDKWSENWNTGLAATLSF